MQLTLTRPDDWHLHVRDGAELHAVLPHTALQFARAIIMPNLKPPVTTGESALAYRRRILEAIPPGAEFTPLMTLYLTDNTRPEDVRTAYSEGRIAAVKYYPAGATTNADSGVTDLAHTHATLDVMQELGVPLLLHGEVTDADIDVFDREAVFIDRHLQPLVQRFPRLKIVLEHITTRNGIEFVRAAATNVGGTITAHHLLLNRNAMFSGGIRPHAYCLPVLKREAHRTALLEAAVSGNPKFFLGTDSAPHAQSAKESACGCAGIYTAHAALELYAEAFEAAGKLDRLEGFASWYGADFYGLPRNTGTVTLVKESWKVPDSFALGKDRVIPFRAGEMLGWRLRGQDA